MPVHFLPTSLAKWAHARGDALVVGFFSDERPLRGAAGLADWRLCGRLSRLIKAGRLSGRRGETLLLPPGRRLPFARALVFGFGDSGRFSEEVYRQHVRWIRDVVRRAGIAQVALQAPGRATGLIAARRALELWIEEARKDDAELEVSFIDSPGAIKEMADLVRGPRAPGPAAASDKIAP
ncbi:MAG: hypothetical protein D6689_22150 [Deltaproteobacteria bacterium]|nr:MAG: hypothetical protein D6689_22150 [Deltaproteobacteria bacterium]